MIPVKVIANPIQNVPIAASRLPNAIDTATPAKASNTPAKPNRHGQTCVFGISLKRGFFMLEARCVGNADLSAQSSATSYARAERSRSGAVCANVEPI